MIRTKPTNDERRSNGHDGATVRKGRDPRFLFGVPTLSKPCGSANVRSHRPRCRHGIPQPFVVKVWGLWLGGGYCGVVRLSKRFVAFGPLTPMFNPVGAVVAKRHRREL
jgi:hypothetical protein